jgi:translation initiation factor 4G
MADPNGVERNGAAPVAINNGHSRKGSLMGDGKRGSLAFGTVDSPNPLLSSSPAAPSVTGQHLADNVKSFGTIEADGTDPNSVKPPSRRTSGLNTPMSPPMQQKKSFDMHAGFKSQQPLQQQVPMQQQPPQFRPPVRSPNMGNAVPPYPNFRPQMPQQQVRPNMQQPPRPPYVPQGYPPQQQPYMYNPQGFYVSIKLNRLTIARIHL